MNIQNIQEKMFMSNKSLYNFCGWNDTKRAQELLDLFDDIDILYENGVFFDLAISKGNVEICKSLLNYFENKQFPTKNTEYQEAREKLVEILENATDSIELSPEIKEVLSPYIDFENSEHNTLNDSFSNLENLLVFNYDESHHQPEEHNTTNVALSGNNIQEVH